MFTRTEIEAQTVRPQALVWDTQSGQRHCTTQASSQLRGLSSGLRYRVQTNLNFSNVFMDQVY